MKRSVFSLLTALTFSASMLSSALVFAGEVYPSKAIKIVMPVPPGSGLDVVIRLVGEKMAAELGQPIIVENKPGAGGAIAADTVLGTPHDGYTLLGGAASVFTILPAGKEKPAFDVNRDFVQVGLVNRSAMVLAVGASSDIKTFADFVAAARAKPESVSVGMTGAGTLPHFAGLELVKEGHIPLTLVPYAKGGTMEAIKDILGGRVVGVIDGLNGLKGAIDGGQLRPIATLALEPEAALPGVPAVAQTVPGFHAEGFMTLAAPAGTPDQAVQKLNAALKASLGNEAIKAKFAQIGIVPTAMSPDETRTFVEMEEKLWWPVVRELGTN